MSDKLHVIPVVGSTGFKFSFLAGDQPCTTNMLDFVCVALAKLADKSDPIIIESWRALDRAAANGEKAGYERGYRAGLAAGAAVALGEDEVKRIAGGAQ